MIEITHLKRKLRFEIDGIAPFNFELTVHKPRYGYLFTPLEKYSRKMIWTGVRLSRGVVGLKLRSVGSKGNPLVSVNAYSIEDFSSEEEEEIADLLKNHLQLDVDISDFYRLAEEYPALRQAKKDLYGMRDTHFPDLFNAAIVAITLQMTRWERSLQMIDSLYKEYGEKLIIDNTHVIITPAPSRILKASDNELRQKCALGYRGKFIRNAAKTINSNFHTLEDLKLMPSNEAKAELMRIGGIGEYSADIMTPHPSFPVDSWSVKIFSDLFGLKGQEKPEKTIPIVKEYARKEFGQWQGYVYAYILHDLENIRKIFHLDLKR